jgi:hypothetical protein
MTLLDLVMMVMMIMKVTALISSHHYCIALHMHTLSYDTVGFGDDDDEDGGSKTKKKKKGGWDDDDFGDGDDDADVVSKPPLERQLSFTVMDQDLIANVSAIYLPYALLLHKHLFK